MKPDFQCIYLQRAVLERPSWRQDFESIAARFPGAEVVEVDGHQVPQLYGADPAEWMHSKRRYLVLGVRKTMRHVPNGRSADFIAASPSNGCLSACQYCYVSRSKGGSNPLTLFLNLDGIIDAIDRHQRKLGPKAEPNQCDPHLWTYDIGCNSDLSVDALVWDGPGRLIEAFAGMEHARATFATKTVNDDFWQRFDPKGRTRIRYSLMPQPVARYVDINTSKISERIDSINRLVAAGYQVHLNFSPIILYGGDQWRRDWRELWQEIDDVLTPEAKGQLACEAFFLTHSADLHEVNLQWNPRGEDFLWAPQLQAPKRGKPDILVYDYGRKRQEVARFRAGVEKYLPYCPVRYIF